PVSRRMSLCSWSSRTTMSESDDWANPVAGAARRPAASTASNRANWTERVMMVARWLLGGPDMLTLRPVRYGALRPNCDWPPHWRQCDSSTSGKRLHHIVTQHERRRRKNTTGA